MLTAFTFSEEMYSVDLIMAMNAAKQKMLVTTIVEGEVFISRVYPKNNILHHNIEWIDLMKVFIEDFIEFNRNPEDYRIGLDKEVEEYNSIPRDRMTYDLKRWLKGEK